MCASCLKLGSCKAWLNGFAMISVDNFMHTGTELVTTEMGDQCFDTVGWVAGRASGL